MKSVRQVPELALLDYVEGTQAERNRFVEELFKGIKDYGFIILKNHNISESLIDEGYQQVKRFFTLPEDVKRQYFLKGKAGQRGLTPFGSEHAKNSQHKDLKEFYHIGRELPATDPDKKELHDILLDNVWPKEVPEFKDSLLKLYHALDTTAVHLLDALGEALDVPDGFFRGLIRNSNSILRLIHYPPVVEKGPSLRAAPHEDINLITLLVGATDSGLELLDRDGQWLPVETRPGEIVVDSGDMLSRITNEVIPSTTHRVVNPPNSTSTRYSMPFFVHPHPKALLTCLPSCLGKEELYPPILSHDFLMQRLREIGLV